VFGRHWSFGAWDSKFTELNITALEFYPIVAALAALGACGHEFKNSMVMFHTDNEALVHIINNASSRDPLLSPILRQLVLLCVKLNITFRA
jgi:hypothetical protein